MAAGSSSSAANTITKYFKFRCAKDELVDVEEEVAMEFDSVKKTLIEGGHEKVYTFSNVAIEIMLKIISYCEHHIASRKAIASLMEEAKGLEGKEYEKRRKVVETEMLMIEEWDEQFMDVDKNTIFALTEAADHFGVKGLSDMTYKVIVNKLYELPPDQAAKFLFFDDDSKTDENEAKRGPNE